MQLALQGKTESDGSPITLIRSPARMWPLPHPIRVPAARGRCRHRIADADVPRVPLRGSCSSRCYSTFFVSGQWSVSDPVGISTTLPPELGGQPRCLSDDDDLMSRVLVGGATTTCCVAAVGVVVSNLSVISLSPRSY
jgi:hypothetical protein